MGPQQMVEADRGDLQLWDTWPVRICAEQDTAGSTLGIGAGSAASRSANDEVGCWRGLAGALGQPGPFTACPVQGGLLVGPSPWKLEGQGLNRFAGHTARAGDTSGNCESLNVFLEQVGIKELGGFRHLTGRLHGAEAEHHARSQRTP